MCGRTTGGGGGCSGGCSGVAVVVVVMLQTHRDWVCTPNRLSMSVSVPDAFPSPVAAQFYFTSGKGLSTHGGREVEDMVV